MSVTSSSLHCRPQDYVNIDAGITVSGDGISVSAIASPAVLFPLRLGYACAAGAPLPTVTITGVESIVEGISTLLYLVAPTDPVNTRTSPCPASNPARRLQPDATRPSHHRSLRVAAARAAYVATSGTVSINGTYVLVRLRVSVAVPQGAVGAAGGNLSSIAAVADMVAGVSRLLPSSTSSSAALDLAYGPFLTAAASSVGVNESALSVGTTGVPVVAVAAGSTGSSLSNSSSTPSLAAGAVAGIVIAILLAICLAAACCCFVVKARKAASKEPSASPPAGIVPSQMNPLHAPSDVMSSKGVVSQPALHSVSASVPLSSTAMSSILSEGMMVTPADSDALPVVRNPMLVQRDLRSASSAAAASETASAGTVSTTQPPRNLQLSTLSDEATADCSPSHGLAGVSLAATPAPAPPASSRRPLDSNLAVYTNPISRALVGSVAQQRRAGIDVRGTAPVQAQDPQSSISYGPPCISATDLTEAASVGSSAPLTPQLPRLRREALLLPTASASSSAVSQHAMPATEDVPCGTLHRDVLAVHSPQLPRPRASRVSHAGTRAARGTSGAGAGQSTNVPVAQSVVGEASAS